MTRWRSAPIAALKEAGKLASVKVGGFDGSPDAVAAIKAGELQYTVLQPVAVYSKKAVDEADSFLKTGKTGAASEKQLFDCTAHHQRQYRRLHRSVHPQAMTASGGASFGTLPNLLKRCAEEPGPHVS